jgi:hypothetical protein
VANPEAVDRATVQDTTTSGPVLVGDGLFVVVPVRGPAAKGKRLVLLVRPTIRIEEEERARRAKGE